VTDPVEDVTVVIPYRRGANTEWLAQAKGGFPVGQKLCLVENEGEMAEALNDAISNHVDTEWVYRFDADDVAHPGLLHKLRSAVWDGTDVAYPSMVLAAQDDLSELGVYHADPFCPRRLELRNFVTGASLFRRDLFVKVGGYRDLVALEDWDLWLRMLGAGATFKPVPEAMFAYRQVGGSRNKLHAKMAAKVAAEIQPSDPAGDALATFYYQGTPFGAHIRCVSPAKYLPAVASPVYHVAVEEHDEQPAFRFPEHRGAAVVQYPGTQMHSMMVEWLKINGHRVLVETDDNYTVTGGRIARRAGWQARVVEQGKKVSEQRPSVEGHLRIVRGCDGVICSTEYLAERYRKHNRNVFVCPNQVEPDEWAEPDGPDDGVFRIGWYSSFSHDKDWGLIRKALEWASRQRDVEIVLMGDFVFNLPNVRYIPWADDWQVYRHAVGMLDVGLAPVLPEEWSLGRSDLKALDYAMGAAVPVLQDEAPYAGWEHGEMCLKAKGPDDWLRQVKRLVYARDEAREMGQAAREHVLTHRTFKGNSWRWLEAISSVERTVRAA